MKKYPLLFVLAASALLTGCSRDERPSEYLVSPADDIAVVVNFSSFEETELITQTEAETETETETETEAVTETEEVTEMETELPYIQDFDFSDYRILRAVLREREAAADTAYSSTIVQDYKTKERTQKIEAEDGSFIITLFADPTSGATNKSLDIVYNTKTAAKELASILLGFDNGLTDENISRFLNGYYNGGNAPLIGLSEALCEKNADGYHIKMVKSGFSEGQTPFWTDLLAGNEIAITSNTGKKITFSKESMEQMLTSIEFDPVFLTREDVLKTSQVIDADGRTVSYSCDFQYDFDCTNGHRYSITGENGQLAIHCIRNDAKDSSTVLNLAEYICQEFYGSEVIDKSFALSSASSYVRGGYKICLEADGFTFHLL